MKTYLQQDLQAAAKSARLALNKLDDARRLLADPETIERQLALEAVSRVSLKCAELVGELEYLTRPARVSAEPADHDRPADLAGGVTARELTAGTRHNPEGNT